MSFACRLCSFLRMNWNLLFEKPQKRGLSIVLSQRVKQGRKANTSGSWCVQLSSGLFLEGSPLNPSCLVPLNHLAFLKPSIPRSSSVAIFFLQYRSPPPTEMSKGWPKAVINIRPLYDMNQDLALPVHNRPLNLIPNLSSLPFFFYFFSSEVRLSSMAQQSVHPIINEFLLCPKSNEHFRMQD